MKESDELLDVLSRLKFIECLVNFLDPVTFPESQEWRLPILRGYLRDDLDCLKEEIAALIALESGR